MRMMSEIISLPFYDIRWMKKMVILRAKRPVTALRQRPITAGEQV